MLWGAGLSPKQALSPKYLTPAQPRTLLPWVKGRKQLSQEEKRRKSNPTLKNVFRDI